MKFKFFIISALFSMLFGVQAQTVSVSDATTVAENFFSGNSSGGNRQKSASQVTLYQVKKSVKPQKSTQGVVYYYIFNNGNNGYVVVGGDKRMLPVLAYSDNNAFDTTDMPANVKYWFDLYQRELDSAIQKGVSSNEVLWQEYTSGPPTKDYAVDKMLTTQWGQSAPYNDKCPLVGTKRSVTGCGATAMAQIMKFWAYPKTGVGTHSYTPETNTSIGTLTVNFGNTTYDWANMINKPTSSSTTAQKNAVSTIMYHCGVALQMDYDPDGSGAYSLLTPSYIAQGDRDIPYALKKHFRYSSAFGRFKSDYSDAIWKALIKEELDKGRPILYSGEDVSAGGHGFICDGYDNNDKFHFNFGWNGSYDGYYALTAITPDSYNFASSQNAIFAFVPDSLNTELNPADMRLYLNKMTISSTTVTSNGSLSIEGRFANYGYDTLKNGQFGLAIYDHAGNLVTRQAGNFSIMNPYSILKPTFTVQLNGIAQGAYYAKLCYKLNGDTNWYFIGDDANQTEMLRNRVDFYVLSNKYITLNVKKDSLISISLATNAANTPIRIVSGDSVYDFTTTSTSLTNATYRAGANTMTIYGDVNRFDCRENSTKITGLDVSHNTALTTLNCVRNQLTSLDVSKNTALIDLNCYFNQLTILDVRGCTALTNLYCYSNQLTSLDVSGCTALTYLNCTGNQLTSLDVTKNTALINLYCYTNQLTSLDVSSCTALKVLTCHSNKFSTAGYDSLMCSLPVRNANDNAEFCPLRDNSDGNKTIFLATNATNAKAKNWQVMYRQGGNIPATSGNYDCVKGYPQVNMSRYITLNVTKDSEISIRLATDAANTLIRIVSGDSVYDFTTTSTSLTTTTSYRAGANTMTIYGDVKMFRCNDNNTKITGIDVSKDTGLTDLNCSNNDLTSLDLSKNVALCTLRCGNNKIQSLNVSGCTVLTELYCGGNPNLTNLDLSGCSLLTRVDCYDNVLTNLSLKGCNSLTGLSCQRNQLTSLDLSDCTALAHLRCENNQMTSLDVSKNTALTYLKCDNSKLTSLDVSNLTSLTEIICYINEISSLNVSNCKALKKLDCGFNNLTTLDVSGCDSLNELMCDSNKFTTAGFDFLMCSLPDRNGGTEGYFRPLRDANDGTYSAFMVSNSQNAKAKNWQVRYGNNGPTIPATSGNYDCSGVNMNRYITLNVTQNSLISINLSADTNNTPIKIVSGAWDTTIIATTSLIGNINYPSNDTIITIYGDVREFHCNNNKTKITGIDVSQNVALCSLSCYTNQLTSLDLSKNTALTYLNCCQNNLTTLDVSSCPALNKLLCYTNEISSLNVSNCKALKKLDCGFNNLITLDVSDCDSLNELMCDSNKFTTGGFDSLMCSLPDRSGNTEGYFRPLRDANDGTYSAFMVSNSQNAQAKNWQVRYGNSGPTIPATSGNYDCIKGYPQANMNRYITLNIKQGELISIDLSADTNNTPIKIVSGAWDTTIIAGIGWTGNKNYRSAANTMVIYGDVDRFNCSYNDSNIIGLDASHNIALTELRCYDNNLAILDVSGCTSLEYLDCDDNNLTSLNVSGCTALWKLNCDDNNLTSLNVSGCIALTNLSCYFNNLTTLDVSGCTSLEYLFCNGNNLTSLNVSGCTALRTLYCYNNNLTTLNVSGCTSLVYLYCYGNKFSTAGYDSLICSLPSRNSGDNARFCPLDNANDANSATFLATNASNATAKNWQVLYYDNGNTITTNGTYSCSGGDTTPQANMNRYITLNVKQGEQISINLSADTNNTPIKIVSGIWDTTIIAGTNRTGSISYPSNDTIMTIYGDVKEFDCGGNYSNISSLDASHNTALIELYCENNNLDTLDVSACINLVYLVCYSNNLTSLAVNACTNLKGLECSSNNLTTLDVTSCANLIYLKYYGNKFSTAGYDSLMCLLPNRNSGDNARFYPLYNANDANSATFLAANASNATAKNWQVLYDDNGNSITTNGTYSCSGGDTTPQANMNRYITLNVTKDSVISIRLATDVANTPIRIVSGDSVYDFTTTSTSLTNATSYRAGANTMVIYGDVREFHCNNNNTKITGIDVSQNVALCSLSCYTNQLTSLDISKNTALTYLNCCQNNLTTLDVSSCPALNKLLCYTNEISSLNVSNCKALKKLDCGFNNLISLDVSDCDSLNELVCDSNKFTTAGFDSLMCSLPDRNGNTEGYFRPLRDANDGTYSAFMVSNSQNAQAKNWQVRYGNSGPTIPATSGTYSCSGGDTTPQANMNRYITLNVKQGEQISINLSADSANTPIKIASGIWDTTIIADINWTGSISYPSNDTIMTIYGDVKDFDCGGNYSNIIGLDASHNIALTELRCYDNNLATLDVSACINLVNLDCDDNNLTSLNVSGCTNLKVLYCSSNNLTTLDVTSCTNLVYLVCYSNNLTSLAVNACTNLKLLECSSNNLITLDVSACTSLNFLGCIGNKFSTAGYDSLMCLLPNRNSTDTALFYPLYNAKDTNATTFLAANASNATAKNWQVVYLDNNNQITTNGNYDCNGGGGTPEDTTSISEVNLSNIALYPNPAKTMLNIENATEDVQIFDITGRLLINVENKETNLLQINVSNLAKGMYFVKVGNYTIKFVKE